MYPKLSVSEGVDMDFKEFEKRANKMFKKVPENKRKVLIKEEYNKHFGSTKKSNTGT